MALFQDTNINLVLKTLRVLEYSDRWFGVEPYIIPIFFKIDGEKYSAFLRILNTQPAREGTTEVTETSPIQLQIRSNPIDEPLIFFPPGPILRPPDQQDIEVAEGIDISDIEFRTTLQPIPLVIDVLGIWDLTDLLGSPFITDVLDGIPINILNLVFENVSGLLGQASGLDEELDSCPENNWGDDFINTIEAQFQGLIPGTVGGLFVVMENDDMDEDDVRTLRDTISELLIEQINNVTNSIARVNPIPETDNLQDELEGDGSLIAEIAWDLVSRLDPGFWFLGTVGWLVGAPDDPIGTITRIYQMPIDEGGDSFSATVEDDAQENRWRITGELEIV